MKPGKKMLISILCLIAMVLCVAAFGIGDEVKGITKMRYGIDIRGGVEAIFEPQNIDRAPTKEELEMAREVIEVRLDAQKIADREVTVDQEGGYIIVRFPWKSDETNFSPEDAISELGEMAKLTFRDASGTVLIEGKDVANSTVQKDTNSLREEYVVSLNFSQEGAKLFGDVTGKLIGKQLGIYMDETMISNPVVQSQILGGQAVINGMSSYEEAKALSDKINSGALPFSLKTTSFSTISPSLGNSALHIMIIAGVAALAMVCLFMLIYYKLSGAVACVILILQMALQLLAISIPQYTLTLPGIAGVILSLGMAVDANIVISERISEELKKITSVRVAVRNGYKNGFTSVLDGNMTTAVVAVILMLFGSGAMLSFGYTLLIGMIINIVVGVTLSKGLQLSLLDFNYFNHAKWFRDKKEIKVIKFYENRKKWLALSGIVFAVGIGAICINKVTLDTQFTGGVVLNYRVDKNIDFVGIEEELETLTKRAVTIQTTEGYIDDYTSIQITLAGTGGMTPEMQKQITEVMSKVAEGNTVSLAETYAVEPYIGAKAMKNAGIAIVLSLIFIVVYVRLRFQTLSGLSAGLTALVALFHDILVVFFAFAFFKIPLNDSFVAVTLTIIGYSINDTIIVYDRMRENNKLHGDLDVTSLTNLSVSQVLARSLNTSFTTSICILTILIISVVFQIDSIIEFSLPMFLGLLSGCYSSICIASVLWTVLEKRKVKEMGHVA